MPSPAWKTLATIMSYSLRQRVDALEHLRQLRARDHAVLDEVVGGDAPHRGERGLAHLPEELALGLVAGDADVVGAAALADRHDLVEARLALVLGAVELDQQARRRGRTSPAWAICSDASIARASIISIAPGTTPPWTISDTASPAAWVESKNATSVLTVSGDGTTRSQTLVATPSVPSLPTNAPSRS